MLALNSSTESPSFVFLAPVYAWGVLSFSKASLCERIIFVLGLVMMSLISMDPLRHFPLPTWSGLRYDYKSLGLVLWFASGLASLTTRQ